MEQKIQTIIWASLLSLGICSVADARAHEVFNAKSLELNSSMTMELKHGRLFDD